MSNGFNFGQEVKVNIDASVPVVGLLKAWYFCRQKCVDKMAEVKLR